MKSINRKQALSILHAVVDDEASERERIAFFQFIDHHPDVKNEFEETLLLKRLLSEKLSKQRAPEHLRVRVLHQLRAFENENVSGQAKPSENIQPENQPEPFQQSSQKQAGKTFRILSAAAIVLFISLLTVHLLERIVTNQESTTNFVVENIAAQHFISSGGEIIEPLFETNSTTEAEQFLSEQFEMDVAVPLINGVEFAGVVMMDFIDDFQTPMLEYVDSGYSEAIYLFVFDVDQVIENKVLERHHEAVKTCILDHDFYVTELDGHHAVSWLWNNTWYTAVSNHDGHHLASLVDALN
jgi:hypothetical protein